MGKALALPIDNPGFIPRIKIPSIVPRTPPEWFMSVDLWVTLSILRYSPPKTTKKYKNKQEKKNYMSVIKPYLKSKY